jgi:hypothetical protein
MALPIAYNTPTQIDSTSRDSRDHILLRPPQVGKSSEPRAGIAATPVAKVVVLSIHAARAGASVNDLLYQRGGEPSMAVLGALASSGHREQPNTTLSRFDPARNKKRQGTEHRYSYDQREHGAVVALPDYCTQGHGHQGRE